MASSVWHTAVLYVYLTFKNLLNCNYCRLCVSVCRRGAVTLPELSPDRKRPLRLSLSGERRVREGGGRKGGRGEGGGRGRDGGRGEGK